MRQFTYAVKLTPDKDVGGYVVTCRELPEAITLGETVEEALTEAADCLEEAIAGRIDDERAALEALKAAVFLAGEAALSPMMPWGDAPVGRLGA
jgi:predicted RNase H-like HicB family nuclease